MFVTAILAGLTTAAAFAVLSSSAATSDHPLPAASSAPAPVNAASAEVPVLDLAAAGDPKAIEQLERQPAERRTIDDLIAIANGKAVQRKALLGTLSNDLHRNPKLAEDPDVLKRLRDATRQPELARDALGLLASLPGSTPVDIIYDVWVGTKKRTPTTELAQALVYVKQVRAKASPALAVALDLREAQTCEQAKPIVARAIEVGDRRSLRLLGKLTQRFGCGPGKAHDCYPCLRGDHAVLDALKAVGRRRAPKF